MDLDLSQTLSWKKSLAAATPSAAAELAMLSDLQGNILKGHGRHSTANLFLVFDPARQAASRHFLSALAVQIGSALDQLTGALVFKASGLDAGTFVSLLLTAKGYDALGRADARPGDAAFLAGMKARQLGDPAPSTWGGAFAGDVHAMMLIASSTAAQRDRDAAQFRQLVAATLGAVRIAGEEMGNALFNSDQQGIEHFGYVDGRSQPLPLQEDVDNEQQNTDGIDKWNPAIPLSQVLAKDPGGKLAVSFGSYFVFRKLEQDVKAFKAREDALADTLGGIGERAGASVVGRFENGTPVVASADELPFAAPGVPNNFSYAGDPDGLKCPFAGHIRKSNPRDGIASSKSHLMARRGIPYGARSDDPNDGRIDNKPSGGVGLLFMAYQSDIAGQFEFTQVKWVNNVGFPGSGTGIDPVIGQPAGGGKQRWPVVYGQTLSDPLDFSGHVTMKGGEYFFAPSLSFLRGLGA